MVDKKTKALAAAPTEEQLAFLQQATPTEVGFTRAILPRLGMFSQDVTEGKGKAMKVVTEAGTFFLEYQTEEVDEETGKKLWAKDEIGDTVELIIPYFRKQLRHYNEDTKVYTSSPVYDGENDEVVLFRNKKEIARGTPQQLRSLPEFTEMKDGKKKSTLEENRVLYVLYKGEMHQMNIRGSSMWAFSKFTKSLGAPLPTFLLTVSSEAMENGAINWNQMTFTVKRSLTAEETAEVIDHVKAIQEGIQEEKAYFASRKISSDEGGERDITAEFKVEGKGMDTKKLGDGHEM